MSVVDSVEILKRRPLTDEEYVKAAVLGWGIEFVSQNRKFIDQRK